MATNKQHANDKNDKNDNLKPNEQPAGPTAQAQGNTVVATQPVPNDKKDTRKDPKAVVENMDNKSKAIRALSAAGYTTAEIAKMSKNEGMEILRYKDGREIRYQHVRNVLMQPIKDVG